MNKLRLQNQGGFTLIELLVVVAIIGILAAIAIPQFAAYRKRGHEAQVKSDIRNAAVAQEAYFASNSTYFNGTLSQGVPPGFNRTTGVNIAANVVGNGTYSISASHANCGTTAWVFSSVTGSISTASCP